MGANLLSYQICKRYGTTHHFYLFTFMYEGFELFICFLLYLYIFCCILMQGLVNAIIDVCSEAEHRWCACHIFANWSKRHRRGEMKRQFWKATWSTIEEEFVDNMRQLGDVSSNAAKDLINYPPHIWVRAYFSGRCKLGCG